MICICSTVAVLKALVPLFLSGAQSRKLPMICHGEAKKLNRKTLEHQLGIPGSTKTFQENVDLDLHLSASDRGRLVLHILKVGVRKESLCVWIPLYFKGFLLFLL